MKLQSAATMLLCLAAAAAGYLFPLRAGAHRVGFADTDRLMRADEFVQSAIRFSERLRDAASDADKNLPDPAILIRLSSESGRAAKGFASRFHMLRAAVEAETRDVFRFESQTLVTEFNRQAETEYGNALRRVEKLYGEALSDTGETLPGSLTYRLFNLKLKLKTLTRDQLALSEIEERKVAEQAAALESLLEKRRSLLRQAALERYEADVDRTRDETLAEYERRRAELEDRLRARLGELEGVVAQLLESLGAETTDMADESRDFRRRVHESLRRLEENRASRREAPPPLDQRRLFIESLRTEAGSVAQRLRLALLVDKPVWHARGVTDCTERFERKETP
ncbi:MAG: hypothetical protein AB1742_08150 [bacterium]